MAKNGITHPKNMKYLIIESISQTLSKSNIK